MIIFVVGMHRSGSSVISRSLKAAGVSHTDNLMAANKDNKKGFWEDEDFTEFNENLLCRTGQAWFEPKATNHEEMHRLANELDEEAISLLNRKTSSKKHICLKDPRLSNLIPFWKQICDNHGIETRFIASYRHPIENATSIQTRDKIDINQALLIWSEHYINILANPQIAEICFIKYNDVLSDPKKKIQELANYVGQPIIIDELNDFQNEFLEKSLCNNSNVINNSNIDSKVLAISLEIYHLIDQQNSNKLQNHSTAETRDQIKEIAKKIIEKDPNFSSIGRYQTITLDIMSEMKKSRQDIYNYYIQTNDQAKNLQQARQDIHDLHSQINTQASELQQARQDIHTLHTHINSENSELQQARQDIHTLHAHINSQNSELQQANQDLATTREELIITRKLRQESQQRYAKLLDQIEVITNTFWWKTTYLLRLFFSSKRSKDNLRGLKRRLNKRTVKVNRLNSK